MVTVPMPLQEVQYMKWVDLALATLGRPTRVRELLRLETKYPMGLKILTLPATNKSKKITKEKIN